MSRFAGLLHAMVQVCVACVGGGDMSHFADLLHAMVQVCVVCVGGTCLTLRACYMQWRRCVLCVCGGGHVSLCGLATCNGAGDASWLEGAGGAVETTARVRICREDFQISVCINVST